MRIITADETGLVKVVRLESGECLAVSAGQQARANAVRGICLDPVATSRRQASDFVTRIHVARVAGVVETWDVLQSEREGNNGNACKLTAHANAVECSAAPVALACLPPASSSSGESSRVLTCNGEGEVQISRSAPDGGSKDEAKLTVFSIRGPISAAITAGTSSSGGRCGSGLTLAAGGKENDLKTWDVSTGQCIWKAKNVPHDFLDLRQPVWITSLCPLGVPEANGGSGGLQQIVAGTAHRQVRLYDARAQKRPTHSIDADEHGITTMAVAPDGREVVVADTAGLVRVLDLRKIKWGRRFEGPAGSVRSLAFHPTLPVLACVGLDRMARVYDYPSREQKFQVYLKQRLNAVLFDAEGEVRVAAAAGDAEDVKKKSGAKERVDWSGSEGWGSGEEYEMDEAVSSEEEVEEEEEEEGHGSRAADKRRTAGRVAMASGRKPSIEEDGTGEESSEEESSEEEEDESVDDDVDTKVAGAGDDGSSEGDDSDSEGIEEESRPPPPKRRNVQKAATSVKKTAR